ncbi:MAG: hypothetical protein ACFFAU_10150 [Candidatus Hodarchaeota archaeon]
MDQERLCLECDRIYPQNSMIRGTKTNSYGDKVLKGYLCLSCFRKRVEKRSVILLIAGITFFILSVLLFLTIPLYLLVTQVYIEENFTNILGTYLSWGGLMAIFGIIMLLVRRREFKKMEKQLEIN